MTTTTGANKVNPFLSNNFDTIQSDLMELEQKERVKFYIELLSFGLPKLKNIGLESDLQDIIVILPQEEPGTRQ